jgi:alpha-galactosidase
MPGWFRSVLSSFVFLLLILVVDAPSASAAPVERAGSASISTDPDAGTWTIRSSTTSLVLGLGRGRDFELVSLTSLGGVSWTPGGASDTFLRIGGQTVSFGSRAAGFAFDTVTTSVSGLTVRLDATFQYPASRVTVTRHYAATSGSPTFETWTTIAPAAGAVTLADLNGFRFSVRAGPIRWLNGLQGDDPQTIRDEAFTIHQRQLAAGERLSLGATGRSSETTVPWFSIDGGADQFFAGLMWSGAWSLIASRTSSGLDLTLGLAPMSTSVTAAIDTPHAFFGVVRGTAADVPASLRAFIVQGIRGGQAFPALATYNTWFAYGVEIDETIVREEIDGAARLGAELFVVDAGWYAGAGRLGSDDFTSGLGTWAVDPARFPQGLRPLTEYAHSRGLKFGIWVEPERVALTAINRAGLAQESWLARIGGQYGSSNSAQICLGGAAAREWVLDQLVRLIDAAQPDYLKWDNNLWVNCDRSGHGHGAADGNFAHVTGLYQVLAALRSRYPALTIENVSGGGNRLDLGMLRYTDVAWMDDRTAPSVHVRHNVQGLSVVFPPAYLLSFVTDHDTEPLHRALDVSLYFRSRMTGVLGLCFRTGEFGDEDGAQMAREIGIYKTTRDALGSAAGALLTAQADPRGGPSWDVFQIGLRSNRTATVLAFQWDAGAAAITVKPVRLQSQAIYMVRSVDGGVLGTATGAELMADGISILRGSATAAHVLILERQ